MNPKDKPLVWLHGIVKAPPFSAECRLEAGYLLRQLQRGDKIWRIVYRIDPDAIVVADVFMKKTETTPKKVIDVCKSRFRMYNDAR